MIELKMLIIEPATSLEAALKSPTRSQIQMADIIIESDGRILKDRHGVLGRIVNREVQEVMAITKTSEREHFIRSTASQCLAAMLANPVAEEDTGNDEKGTFLSYGDPAWGANRAAQMAEALASQLCL